MPLTRGNVVGYDPTRMSFQFIMMTPIGKPVACEVSSIAMDLLAGVKGTLPSERERQFPKLRDQIESAASELFDKDNLTAVRLFAKHFSVGKRNDTV
jgi:Protein of unknown function (DUF1488)